MSAPRLPFRNLLAFLPEVEVLEGLRFALARHALTDPSHQWSDVETAGTIDVRVLDSDAVLAAVKEAAASAHQEVNAVFGAVAAALTAALDGSSATAAQRLIEAGEEREANSRYSAALRFFRAAYEVALPAGDRHTQIIALRRMGRLMISSGDVLEADRCYRQSVEIARDVGELRQEIIARTGLGNVYLRVGRWLEAEKEYREALQTLDQVPEVLLRERAQLFNNMAQVVARFGRYQEAQAWLDKAFEAWKTVHSPVDLAISHSIRAHICWEQGALEDARAAYHTAIAQEIPDLVRAVFEIDLAGVYLEVGDSTAARAWGREAERSALSAGSVGYLAEVYRGLGNIERDTGGEPVALYEKSLEIARKNGLRLAEAQTLVDYARLQRGTGNEEEARAFLEHSVRVLDELGAREDARRAREELVGLGGPDGPEPLTA